MDAAERDWRDRVAEAARKAADDLRRFDDLHTMQLREDLDAYHAELTSEAKPPNGSE